MSSGKLTVDPAAHAATGLNTTFVQRQLDQHRTLTADNRAFLWNILVMGSF
jgi:hypothetical protein